MKGSQSDTFRPARGKGLSGVFSESLDHIRADLMDPQSWSHVGSAEVKLVHWLQAGRGRETRGHQRSVSLES